MSDPQVAANHRPPADTLAQLKAIWCEVLQQDDVTPESSFVGLGGDSLSATLCVFMIKQRLGCAIAISMLLDVDTTLDSLAVLIDQRSGTP